MGQVFVRVLRCAPVNTIAAMVHTHLHLHAALIRRTNRPGVGTFKNAMICRKAGSVEYKITYFFIIQRNNDEGIAVTTGRYSFGYKPFS